jgi:pimeloyl-ACP methyl ester carboxylesterase
MPHKYVAVEGVATFVHTRGRTTLPERPPDTSRGEVVLCLHGRGGNGHVFAGTLEALAERHSPLAYDQPGHGRSGALDALGSIGAHARFCAALLGKLRLRPCVLLGHDLGAAVALELALARPELVRGLVLCAGAPRFEIADAELARLRRVVEGKARREFEARGASPAAPREAMARAFAEWLKTDPRALLGDLLALRAWSAEGRLGAVAAPCLIVDGADAPAADRAAARALEGGLANARRIELAGAGSQVPLEQPAALAGAVEAFLAEPRLAGGRAA